MAHFAKVLDGKVIEVLVIEPDVMENYVDTSPGDWIKTSYNMKHGVYYDPETGQPAEDQSVIVGDEARERKNYAGVGMNYDPDLDIFYENAPFDDWILNENLGVWEPPISMPAEGNWVWQDGSWVASEEN